MACPINRYSNYAAINAYLADRPLTPKLRDYTDPFTACTASFSIGFNRRVMRDTWVYSVTGCNAKAGFEGPLKVLRTALMKDCQARGISPGSASLTPLELTPESDPTTAYARLLRGETVSEPYPVPPPITRPIAIKPPLSTSEVSPMVASQYPGGPVPIMPTIPAPTNVGVSGFSTYGIPPVISNTPWKPINGGGPIGGAVETILGGATDWLNRQLFGGGTTGGGETTTSPGTTVTGFTQQGPCPTGYEYRNGQCEKVGIIGDIQRFLPGGATGTLPAVQGGIMPGAVAPDILQTTRSKCPKGMVLGYDGWCYHKAALSNKQRMYPRGRRPLLTGGEMKTLSRARALEGKVKRAWQAAGKPGQTRCRRK